MKVGDTIDIFEIGEHSFPEEYFTKGNFCPEQPFGYFKGNKYGRDIRSNTGEYLHLNIPYHMRHVATMRITKLK